MESQPHTVSERPNAWDEFPPANVAEPLTPEFQAFVFVSLSCLVRLAKCIAEATDLSYSDAFNRLGEIPDRFAGQLESPEGWGRLAAHVTGEVVSPIVVTVH